MAATDILREYLIKLGYKIDQTSAKKFDDSIAQSTKLIVEFAAGVEAAAAVAVAGFARMADGLDKLYFLAKRSQSSVEGIEELQYAFGQLGSSAGAAQSAVANLNRFLQTSPGARGFLESFGVQTRDANGNLLQTNQLLENTAQRLRQMPMYMALARGGAMGLGYEDVQTLRMPGMEGYMQQHQGWMKAAGVDAERAATAANKFSTALRGLYDVFGVLKQRLVQDLGGGFTTAVTQFRDLILSHMDMIKNGIKYFSEGVLAAATVITRILFRIGQAFDELGPNGQRLVELFGAILIAWRVLNAGFLASPLGPILLGLGALLALFDDFKTQQEGGKSLIDWNKLLPAVQPYIDPIKASFTEFKDYLVKDVWPDVRQQAGQFFEHDLQEFGRSVPVALKGIRQAFADLDTDIKSLNGGSSLSLKDIAGYLDRVNKAFQDMGDKVHTALQPVVKFINDEMLLAMKAIDNTISGIVNFLKGDWTAAWNDSLSVLKNVFGVLDEAIAALRKVAPTLASKLFGEAANAGEDEQLAAARAVPGQGGGGGQGSATFDSSVKYLMDKHGMTLARATAFVTNAETESSLNPQAHNEIGGGHYGLFQWSQARQKAIEEHFGKPVSAMSASEQFDAKYWETFEGPEKAAGQRLMAAPNDARMQGYLFSLLDERPGRTPAENEAESIRRGNLAAAHVGSASLAYANTAPATSWARATPNPWSTAAVRPGFSAPPFSGAANDPFSIPAPMNPMGGGSGDISVNQTNNFNITGVSSPQSAADEILRGQRRVASDLTRNLAGAVR